MAANDVLSESLAVVAAEIKRQIDKDLASPRRARAHEGVAYYNGGHDILQYRLFYYDGNGQLKEERYRSNIKIQHQYHTELVDQKVQYLLSNPIEVDTEDDQLNEYLGEYINDDLQELLQDMIEGAANKGREFAYAYIDDDGKLAFQVADSLGMIVVKDDDGQVIAVIRYYDIEITEGLQTRKAVRAELWAENGTTYFIQENGAAFTLDTRVDPNPRPQLMFEDANFVYGASLGYIPFFCLQNNKYERTDLEPIKALVDDYDLMACSLSNNLQDFQEAIYVVKGYMGDDLDTLTQNLKTRKTIGVDDKGGLDIKTVDIPVDARMKKLDIDRAGIYHFGMGFDPSQVGDGNVTNVVIKSRYSMLDLKCNKLETRLRKTFRQMLRAIVQDINARYGKAYDAAAIKVSINRETMVDTDSLVNNAKIEADTQQVRVTTILSAGTELSDETRLRLICDAYDLDYEDEKKRLEAQGPYTDINAASDQLLASGGTNEPVQ